VSLATGRTHVMPGAVHVVMCAAFLFLASFSRSCPEGRRPANPTPATGKERKTMSAPSDAEVIGRSLGEPEAFGLIYDRHAAALLRFLGRRAGATVAEGLVGELFRIAFERRKTFDVSRGSALPWLYGIGSNLLLKHRRGEARRLRVSARMATGRRAVDRRASAAALEARVLFSRVADAIEALPAGEREALLLFAWEELSYEDMAEALELPIGTVRSRLNRARGRLRELLEPKGKRRVGSR
jgi:RNA polymerase sigma-70 factor (ECF subfamily)